jgi:hypothetical protein
MKQLITAFLLLTSLCSYAQEFTNEKNNTIMLMDGESEGVLEIYVDPTRFDCECDGVIMHTLKKSASQQSYKSEDDMITMIPKGKNYVIQVNGQVGCCFVKPGIYSSN